MQSYLKYISKIFEKANFFATLGSSFIECKEGMGEDLAKLALIEFGGRTIFFSHALYNVVCLKLKPLF